MTEVAEPALPPPPRGLRSLFGDSLVYGVSVAATPIALVLATPLLARELDTEGYGVVDLLAALVAFASIVATAGLDSAAARFWFDDEGGRRGLRVVGTAVAAVFLVSCAVALALALAGVSVVAATDTRASAAAVGAAFGLVPLANAQLVARLAFLLPRRRSAYLAAGLVQAFLGAGGAVALVLLGTGPAGYFLGLAAGALAALLFSLARGGLLPAPGRVPLRPMLRYGLPLVPAAAAAWLVFAVDRTLLVAFKDLDEAGLYGLASRVTAPLLLLASAFGIAWPPFIFGQPEERQRELRARALTAVVAAAAALFVVVVLFADELVTLLGGDEFEGAERAVPGIALGWLGWSAANVLQAEFAISRRTSVIGIGTAIAAFANILLNVALIPPYGFVGAAWATAASFVLLAVIFWAWERRTVRVPYDVGRIAAIVAVIAAGGAAAVIESALARTGVAVACIAALAWCAAGSRSAAG